MSRYRITERERQRQTDRDRQTETDRQTQTDRREGVADIHTDRQNIQAVRDFQL